MQSKLLFLFKICLEDFDIFHLVSRENLRTTFICVLYVFIVCGEVVAHTCMHVSGFHITTVFVV